MVKSKKFVFLIDGKCYGPSSFDELKKNLSERIVSLNDYIFDLDKSSWCQIGDHEEFQNLLPSPPTVAIDSANTYLFMEQKVFGPFTRKEIETFIRQKKVDLFHYIFREGLDENWIRLRDCPLFTHLLDPIPRFVPRLESTESEIIPAKNDKNKDEVLSFISENNYEVDNSSRWLVNQNGEELGPFSYVEVLKMIQNKALEKNVLVKVVGEDRWSNMSDVLEFNSSFVRKIIVSGHLEIEKIIIQRKHKRSSFFSPALITFNKNSYHGTCTSISIGGLFVECKIDNLKINDEVDIKILPGALNLTFSTRALVVSESDRYPRGYGFKFLEIKSDVQEKIQNFISKFYQDLEVQG